MKVHYQLKMLLGVLCFIGFQKQVQAQVTMKNDGGYIKVSSGASIHVQGTLKNEGTGVIENNGAILVTENVENNATTTMQTGTGTLELNGTSAQNIGGTNSIDAYNLRVNNTSTGLTLGTDITVTNSLNMTDGDVDLNGQIIDLSTTGTMTGETNTNRILGTSGVIKATRDLNAPTSENVAGLGFEISSVANLGTTEIVRGHTPQTGIGNTSIERYYEVTPTNNSGLAASITFNYLDNELAGQTESNLVAWKSTDGGTTWTNEGGTVNVGNKSLAHSGIDGFSRWTLSDVVNSPLPVELLYFNAHATEHLTVKLEWVTKVEIDNDYFDLERSQDGEHFEFVHQKNAIGNTTVEQQYIHVDEKPYAGLSYYRLKQVDDNGQFTYSEIQPIYLPSSRDNITLHPNLISPSGFLNINGLPTDKVLLFHVYDVEGRLLQQEKLLNQSSVKVYLENFPSATYFYTIQSDNELLKTGRIVVAE